MRVTLSAAVTADGYMDDDSPRRLIISTPGDWEEVYRLRAAHDAILAGAETLRRDDPSLLVRDQAARARRVQAGLKPDISIPMILLSDAGTRSGSCWDAEASAPEESRMKVPLPG